ncbi:MAG: VWA domain-containing protein [Actinomycetota bacterium]|nr:VWA domain-containing protein [Actinomycetota bacterium]
MTRTVNGTPPADDAVPTLAGFARALRTAGIAADTTRLAAAVAALAHVDALDLDQLYWTTRITLCAEPADLPPFDALFGAWFRTSRSYSAPGWPTSENLSLSVNESSPPRATTNDATDTRCLASQAGDLESLRHRPFAELSDSERAEVASLIAVLRPTVATRRSRSYRPRGREGIDVSRTVRAMLRAGEPALLVRRRRREKARRLVLVLDISGSMAPYADVLLRFAHAATRVRPLSTEAGTRLTRITRQLRLRDPELALHAAGTVVPDWSGGTRLGESLRAFLDLWGQRGTARQAVVVIASDGWERGDATLLGQQMARLRRLAHEIIWVNPHQGKVGFVAATAGMQAALPHVDHLVAGHSLDALSHLAELIADA